MNIPQFTTEEWLEVLEPFQQELIRNLLIGHSEEEAMQIWVKVSGPDRTASFGGNGNNNYLRSFKKEFDKLILGDDKYKETIEEFNKNTTVTKFFVVSFISSTLAGSLGVAAGVIAPLIVLILGAIGKMGLNAYKDSIKDK